MPTVSWLLNVRNGMPFLSETLASIESQTFTDYEVLVWVMQSEDGTEEELDRWIPDRLPGRVFKSGLIPLGEARGELVKQSEAEFCAVIDADDISEPDRLTQQVSFLKENPKISLVGTRMRIINERGEETGETFDYPLLHDEMVNDLLAGNSIGHPSVMFRRTAVLEAGNYRSKSITVIEDYDLWMRVAVNHRLANLGNYLVKYRVHQPSLTQQSFEKGLHVEQCVQTFAYNARSLFGMDIKEARRLREGGDDFVLARALRIARHLSSTQGGSTWSRLRSSSLIKNLRSLTRSWDIVSRIAFALLDRNSSLVMELRSILSQLRSKIPIFRDQN